MAAVDDEVSAQGVVHGMEFAEPTFPVSAKFIGTKLPFTHPASNARATISRMMSLVPSKI